ncbi:MAG: Gfo/Idh/MocA family oxidoreductase [Candidatus Brocadiaceae bacterium]|nr:Gfo/Idh/MocA family oxidoreductase [Candidatus Brocadiaceae bacterium]
MDKVKLGVIGCGVMGVRHLAAAARSEHAVPFAAADLMRERAEAAVKEHGAERVYTDGRDLIADEDVDAVVFAAPAAHRDALVIEALKAGKHVLIEKPVAMNADVVRRMIEARGDRVAACCSCRFHAYASARAAAAFVSTGALGDLRVIHCRAFTPARGTPKKMPPVWRLVKALNGGGIMANWGCYDLDYLLGVCGWKLEPRLCLAQTWQVPPASRPNVAEGSDAETHAVALVLCEGGTVISFERGEYMPHPDSAVWEVVGTDGSIALHMLYKDEKVIRHDAATPETGLVSQDIWSGTETWAEMQGFETLDFAEAIVTGRAPQTTLEKALIVQRITDAIYRSADTGKAVEV